MLLFILLLIGVAFFTLLEQKGLGVAQSRQGPDKAGHLGVLQPFADAAKLFIKENILIRISNKFLYYISPLIGLILALFLWVVFPFVCGGLDMSLGVFFFICVRAAGVFPIIRSGWASNCKYTLLGGLRGVAQMVSYEVTMAFVLLSCIWIVSKLRLIGLGGQTHLFSRLFLFFPLRFIWFASSLAEINRSPYDFAEGESELVSGFNTEYSAGGFVLVFMAEYANILFMGIFYVLIFIRGPYVTFFLLSKGVLVGLCWVWARGSQPRFRYDKLIGLAWKRFLPVVLCVFCYYLLVF